MDDYLRELVTNFGKSLNVFSSIQGVITLILAIVIILVPSLVSKKKKVEKTKMWNRFKTFWGKSPYRWVVVAIIIMLLFFNAQYAVYKEKQIEIKELSLELLDLKNEADLLKEQYRPILTFNPVIQMSPYVDEINQTANLSIKVNVNNIGERPAYQVITRLCCAPLNDPTKMSRFDNLYEYNPIYKGTVSNININHVGYYSKNGNMGTIIIYFFVKYSNSPTNNDGKWYDDTYWFAFNINLSDKTTVLNSVSPETIAIFQPYITKLYEIDPIGN